MPANIGDNGSWVESTPKVGNSDAWQEATVYVGVDGSWVQVTGGGALDTPLTQIADHVWYMDEGSGTTVTDSVGTSDGAISGADWITGGVGTGNAYLDFPNSSDIIDCGNIFDTQDAVTVSVWGELTSSTDGSYVVQQGVTDGFLIWDPGSVDEIQLNLNGSTTNAISITQGWHMYSFTLASDGSAAFYVDGTQEETFNPGVPSWNSGNAFTFGNREDLARPWRDGVDYGVVSYQEATQTEIADHFEQTRGLYGV